MSQTQSNFQIKPQTPPDFLKPEDVWEEMYQLNISDEILEEIEDLVKRYSGVVIVGVVIIDEKGKEQFEELFIGFDIEEEEVEAVRKAFNYHLSYFKEKNLETVLVALSEAIGMGIKHILTVHDSLLRYSVIAITMPAVLERGTLWRERSAY